MSDRLFDTDCWPAQDGAPEAHDFIVARVREVADEQERNDGRRPTRLAMTVRSYDALCHHPEVVAAVRPGSLSADDRRVAIGQLLGLTLEVV